MLDQSHRTKRPIPRWAHRRHLVQSVVLCLFFLLPIPIPGIPVLDHGLLKIDCRDWHIYLFGSVVGHGQLHLALLGMLLLLFSIALLVALYGKVFCGWLCPQNIFYEAFSAVQKRLKKRFPQYRRSSKGQQAVELAMAALCGGAIVRTAISYFDHANPAIASVLGSALFAFFVWDTAFLKHKFCKNACPYAYLQQALTDKNSLHVVWDKERDNKPCHVCRACVEACYVDLDIRKQTFHIDCTMCGACLDACNRVYHRRGEPPLLQFAFGNKKHQWWGINTGRKWLLVFGFICASTLLFWTVQTRPMSVMRVDYPMSGTKEQLPFNFEGKRSNYFIIKIRNLGRESKEYQIRILGDRFKIVQFDNLEAVSRVKGLQEGMSRVIVQYQEEPKKMPAIDLLTIEVVETGNEKELVVGRRELYFKP